MRAWDGNAQPVSHGIELVAVDNSRLTGEAIASIVGKTSTRLSVHFGETKSLGVLQIQSDCFTTVPRSWALPEADPVR